MKVFYKSRVAYVDTRAGAGVNITSDRNVTVVDVRYGQALSYGFVYLVLHFDNVKVGLSFGERDDKAVLYVIVSASRKILCGHKEFAQVLCRMCHKSVGK